ncbi:MAG: clostripain-related cysteine peptidase, partial [Candidatus Heimdallarchaeota archaeon]
CWDDTTGSGECLTINEIQTAIKGATTAYAETIDVLSFDCCVMGMIEIAYEIRNYCDYLVFSEESIPFDGYNYEPIIAGLQADPTIDPLNFSKLIVDEYANEYDTVESTCLSVIDLSKILATIPYVRNFAGNLTQAIGEYEYDFMANMARGRTRAFYDSIFIDIIDFANRLNYFVDLEMVNLAANELIPVIEETIAYNWQHDSFDGTAHGLSIFLPVSDYSLPEGAMYHYANKTSYFTSLDWSSSSYWGEFIRFYYDHYQLLQSPVPQMLSLGTQSSSQTLDENHHQEFIISIPENGIYEFNLLITSGDVDLKIAASFSEGLQYFGFSNLVNPDDNSDETCRLYLKKNIYYIFIKGINPSSTYKVFVQEYSFPTLALNTPTTTGGGSPMGDGTGHFEQIINYYYTVDLLVDEYLFVLNNSVTTDYEIVLHNSDWSVLAQSGSTTIGEDVILYYNNTVEQIVFITIYCTTGAGNFTIEAIGAARSDLQGLPFLTVTIFSISIFSVITIINVKKQKKANFC